MDNNTLSHDKWNNILGQVKKKGKRKKRIKKASSSLMAVLILVLAWQFFKVGSTVTKPNLDTLDVVMLEEDTFYDEEIGFISDQY